MLQAMPQAMPQAMHGSNAQSMLGAKHATNERHERNVRVQDSGENPSVPDPRNPVDNRKSELMEVRFKLDPRDVWAIQERAERFGVTPGELLRDALGQRREQAAVRDRVRDAVNAGKCDADIGTDMGYPVGRIATIRRELGLKPNPRYPKREERA